MNLQAPVGTVPFKGPAVGVYGLGVAVPPSPAGRASRSSRGSAQPTRCPSPGHSLVCGGKEGSRVGPWAAAGGGGSMLGGVERGCVFTSAGESGILPVSSFLSTAGAVGGTKRGRVKRADGTRGTHAG